MVIQIDIDDTIDRDPHFFSWLCAALKRDNHVVLIVTSRVDSPENYADTKSELAEWDIQFDKLILYPESLDESANDIPVELPRVHQRYYYKVQVARKYRVRVIYDDCGITAELFARYAPQVLVLQVRRI